MTRTIVRNEKKREGNTRTAAEETPNIDGFFSKLAKYIPVEITAAYLAVDYLLVNANPPISENWYWGVFAILVLATPAYLWMVSITEKQKTDIPQLVVAMIAFVIWALGLGRPAFATLSWYNPALAQVAVVLATLIIPIADTIVTHLLKYD
jgi:hypothetical protein